MSKPFVIREIGAQDAKQYAVVEHHTGSVGHIKCLKVWGWFERENDARALAHSMLFPE